MKKRLTQILALSVLVVLCLSTSTLAAPGAQACIWMTIM